MMWMRRAESCSVQSADVEMQEQETDHNRQMLAQLESQPVSYSLHPLTGADVKRGQITEAKAKITKSSLRPQPLGETKSNFHDQSWSRN